MQRDGTMQQPPILAAVEDRVLVITLNRPEQRNALDEASFILLSEHLDRAARDPAIRAVALAAAGPHFSAGADLAALQALVEDRSGRSLGQARLVASTTRRLATLDKPTIALVQGAAHGGGVGLILACDMAVAEEGAQFAVGELRFGLSPGLVAPLLANAMGHRAASRLLLTGMRIDAAEALRLGLVQEVVPTGGLGAALARHAAAFRAAAPSALAATKALLRDARGLSPPQDWDTDWIAAEVVRLREGAEAAEGVRAFAGKRAPYWAQAED